jgi:hypothetical protein
LGYGILLVSTFVVPYWIGFYAWIPALGLAIALAALQGWRSGRPPVIPLAMILYVGAYAIAGLHSDRATFSIIEAGKYFAPPVLALAIAWAAHSPATRRNLMLLGVVAVAIQLPVVVVQAAHTTAQATAIPDYVRGLLASDQANVLGQVAILTAVLVFVAGSVGRIPLGWAIAGTLALVSFGVLCSSKVDYFLAPVVFGVTAVVLWLATPSHKPFRAPAVAATVCALAVFPVLYGGMDALYPGENNSLLEAQNLTPVQQEAWKRSIQASRAAQSNHASGSSHRNGGEQHVTLIPGRFQQLHLALRLSADRGPLAALLGRGIGDTRYKTQSLLGASSEMTSDPITRQAQKTNGVWVARLLSETGYLGLLAFVGLELYLMLLWWRNRDVDPRSWDSVVIYALPGIAAMTLMSALYNTALAIQPYATLFWPLLGIAIAIDNQRRSAIRASRSQSAI